MSPLKKALLFIAAVIGAALLAPFFADGEWIRMFQRFAGLTPEVQDIMNSGSGVDQRQRPTWAVPEPSSRGPRPSAGVQLGGPPSAVVAEPTPKPEHRR